MSTGKKYFEREYYQVRFTATDAKGKDEGKLQAWRFRSEEEAYAKLVELSKKPGTASCGHYQEKVWSESLTLQDIKSRQMALERPRFREQYEQQYEEAVAAGGFAEPEPPPNITRHPPRRR